MALNLLRRYLQVYWLKPFDAVNDAANAWALRQFPWREPVLEVGAGDGVFSFIMHDGEFIFTDDRYDQSDPRRAGDIFDVYQPGNALTIKRHASRLYEAGIDLKWSHVLKCRETKMYRFLAISSPEPLPFASESFRTVFLYFPHGLVEAGKVLDYERALKEIRRVIQRDGVLLMTAVNRKISDCFVCHPFHRYLQRRGIGWLSEYFKGLDGGRYNEITRLSRTPEEWAKLLQATGFRLLDTWTQVTPLAWRIYDFQTRPILKSLIRWSGFLKKLHLKGPAKAAWVCAWLPILAVFYLTFARPRRFSPGSEDEAGVFLAFRAVRI